jgi:hypothetical protein
MPGGARCGPGSCAPAVPDTASTQPPPASGRSMRRFDGPSAARAVRPALDCSAHGTAPVEGGRKGSSKLAHHDRLASELFSTLDRGGPCASRPASDDRPVRVWVQGPRRGARTREADAPRPTARSSPLPTLVLFTMPRLGRAGVGVPGGAVLRRAGGCGRLECPVLGGTCWAGWSWAGWSAPTRTAATLSKSPSGTRLARRAGWRPSSRCWPRPCGWATPTSGPVSSGSRRPNSPLTARP